MPADDALFEKALTRQMRNRGGEAAKEGAAPGEVRANGCPEAEILAAYHERLLAPEEMNLWKEHIVSCRRCQEVLAQLEGTEEILLTAGEEDRVPSTVEGAGIPVPMPLSAAFTAAQHPSAVSALRPVNRVASEAHAGIRGGSAANTKRRRAFVYWIVPASAIAAGLLVWVAVHEPGKTNLSPAGVQTAENRAAPSPGEVPAVGGLAKSEQSAAPATKSSAGPSRVAVELDAGAKENSDVKTPLPALSQPAATATGGRPDTFAYKSADALTSNSPKHAANTATGAITAVQGGQPDGVVGGDAARNVPKTMTQTVQVLSEAAPVVQSPVEGKNVAPLPTGQELQTTQMPPTPPAPAAPKTSQASAADKEAQVSSAEAANALMSLQSEAITVNRAANLRSVAQSQSPRMIAAPGGNVIWRVGKGGLIEQSANAGAVWTRQNSGVSVTLDSGSAPSAAVCWIFGRAGTLLLTVDGGGHWTKLLSPLAGDVGGLLAVDALHATIWDVAKKNNFVTADGGVTWTRVVNP